MPTANHVLLQRITVTSSVSSVTFSGIPQTGYTDLKIVTSVRDTAAVSSTDAPSYTILFNGSSANITQKQLISFQAGGNTSYTNSQMYTLITGANNTANTFASAEVYIPNYTSSNNKSVSIDVVGEGNTTNLTGISMSANQWANSAAITSLQFNAYSSFATGSSFSLYGIANAATTPAAAPKADGGDIIKTDGTYWYHAFTGSGIFKPQLNLTCDYLMVSGGGGGSNSGGIGSGGGAGALFYSTDNALAKDSSTVITVGAGGARDNTSSGPGFAGGSSSIGATSVSVANGARGNYSGGSANGGDGGASKKVISGTTTNYTGGIGSGIEPNRQGGGGAGAGANGSNASGAGTMTGGAGLNTYSAWATATGTGVSGYYAGGGGGGFEVSGGSSQAAGGAGGGGKGGAGTTAPFYNADNGVTGTGGGGGGCGGRSGVIGGTSGNGGSGIVIIRYPV